MNITSICDNHKNGSLGQFLINNVRQGDAVSIVSAYFTIYAYKQLKNQLDQIDHLNFLFGEPTFIKSLDPAKTNKRDFRIEDDKLVIPIESRLRQKSISRECSDCLPIS